MDEIAKDQMPSAVLKDEHKVIVRVIRVLAHLLKRFEDGGELELTALNQCVDFFRHFADACHHAKEEDLLFPLLEKKGIPNSGGPIGVMLSEHTQARAFTREMGEALAAVERGEEDGKMRFQSAAHGYIDLLTNHIDKEDNVLYVMGDNVMSEADQRSLCSQFCEVGCRTFGGKRREELEHLATELEEQWQLQ